MSYPPFGLTVQGQCRAHKYSIASPDGSLTGRQNGMFRKRIGSEVAERTHFVGGGAALQEKYGFRGSEESACLLMRLQQLRIAHRPRKGSRRPSRLQDGKWGGQDGSWLPCMRRRAGSLQASSGAATWALMARARTPPLINSGSVDRGKEIRERFRPYLPSKRNPKGAMADKLKITMRAPVWSWRLCDASCARCGATCRSPMRPRAEQDSRCKSPHSLPRPRPHRPLDERRSAR